MEYLREPLGIGNRHVGYVYLVDADMKVRWAGGGLALKEEAESLRACADSTKRSQSLNQSRAAALANTLERQQKQARVWVMI